MPQIDKSALTPDALAYVNQLEDAVIDLRDQVEKHDSPAEDDGSSVDDLLKSADPALVSYVQGIQKDAEEAKAIAKAEQEKREERDLLAKSAELDSLGSTEEVAEVLKAVSGLDNEAAAKVTDLLVKANGKIETGELFKELGSSNKFSGTGSDRIEKAASKLRDANPELTQEQAVDKALTADPTLYADFLKGE